MKKNMIIKNLIVIVLLMSLVGCAKPNTDEDGRESITFWGSWSGDQVTQLNELIELYNESQESYKVKYVVKDNVEEKLLTGMAGGEIPDVILWDRLNTSMYAEKNVLLALDDFISKDKIDLNEFYEETVKEMNYKNVQYGIPLLVDNRSLFYNKTLLNEAGVNPPKTWEELIEVAEKTTKWENNKLVQSGFSLDDLGLFNMWILQAGGSVLNSDQSETAFNSEEGMAVLSIWDVLLNEKKVYQQGFNDGSDAFAAGKVAMAYNGPWALSDYDKVENLDYGIVPPVAGPNGDLGAITGGFGLVIPRTSSKQEGAWDFMKWWATTPENGIKFAKISNWLPANKIAASDSYFTDNEKYKAFVDTMKFAKIRPTVSGYSNVESLALIPQLENAISGKISPKEALLIAQQQADKILSEEGVK